MSNNGPPRAQAPVQSTARPPRSKIRRSVLSILCCVSESTSQQPASSADDRKSTLLDNIHTPSREDPANLTNANDRYDALQKKYNKNQRPNLDKPLPTQPSKSELAGQPEDAQSQSQSQPQHPTELTEKRPLDDELTAVTAAPVEVATTPIISTTTDATTSIDQQLPHAELHQQSHQHHQHEHSHLPPDEEPMVASVDEELDPMVYNPQFPPPPPPVDPAHWLLPPIDTPFQGKKCLVLDLDETLVHSSFKYIHQADFVIPVEIESQIHNVYVIKRPGVDEFMHRMGQLFEVVVFTASVAKYGDPLLDQLDGSKSVHHRLFRDACYNYQGNYIKNLSQLGRPLEDVIIIDNSPASYIFHPQHAVPVSSWFSDAHDNELLDMIPFLEDLANSKSVPDVSLVLDVNI